MSDTKFRLLHLGIHAKITLNHEAIQQHLDRLAVDWFRYSPNTWLLWTDRSAQEWKDHLRNNPYFFNHTFLLLGIDPSERQGWMPEEVWRWLNKYVPERKVITGLRRIPDYDQKKT